MTVAAAEVTDLAAALAIADQATSRWRRMRHHDDVNQAARIAAWRAFAAERRDPPLIFQAARSAAIDELRRITGRTPEKRAGRRALSIDHPDWVDRPGPDLQLLDTSTLYGLTGRQALIADALAGGHLGQDIAAVLGVHPSRVTQLRAELRTAIDNTNRPGGHQ